MLNRLYIKNYALIEELDVDFGNGLNIITGETGAGKSIIMDALSLILGSRADAESLRDKNQKCIVEAEFGIHSKEIEQFLLNNDFDAGQHCTIRREIASNGKSRSFINDTPATLATIKELTIQLVDIHSQHQTLDIANALNQFEVLDTFSELTEEMALFRKQYKQYKQLTTELEEYKAQQAQQQKEYDYNKFLFDELEKADLKGDEESSLEPQIEVLTNADGIKKQLTQAFEVLDSPDGVNALLKDVNALLSKVKLQSEDFASLKTRVNSAYIELKDIADELSRVNDEIQSDPEKLMVLEDRLNTINSLITKHRVKNSMDLIQLKVELGDKLVSVDELEGKIHAAEKQLHLINEELVKSGNDLFKKRTKRIPELEKKIAAILSDLNMPHARLVVDLKQSNEINAFGNCTIDFLFTANKGEQPKPIHKVASGGEFSRMMLALKSIMAGKRQVQTMIFDEIDTGVSGEVAGKMGDLMKGISNHLQVFAITHLPQVAVKGTKHYKVVKSVVGSKSVSKLILLDDNNRVEEIAKMLSGEKLTPEAIANAKVLLQ